MGVRARVPLTGGKECRKAYWWAVGRAIYASVRVSMRAGLECGRAVGDGRADVRACGVRRRAVGRLDRRRVVERATTSHQAAAKRHQGVHACANRPTDRQIDCPTDLPTDRPTDCPTHRSTDRPSDQQTDRPTDRPNDQRTDKPTDRRTCVCVCVLFGYKGSPSCRLAGCPYTRSVVKCNFRAIQEERVAIQEERVAQKPLVRSNGSRALSSWTN